MLNKARKGFLILSQPFKIKTVPMQEIVREIEKAVSNPPEELAINLIISGVTAKKFHLIKTIISSSMPELDEDDITAYIIRAGVERELDRLSEVHEQVFDHKS